MKNEQANIPAFSDEEIKKSAPMLSAMKKENPFTVPEGYFDSLESEVMKKIEALPDFESVSGKNPFAVPEGYFDSLPASIQERISSNSARRISLTAWITRPVPKYSLAFASIGLLLLFCINYFTRTIHVEYAAQQRIEYGQLDETVLAQLDESVLAEVFAEETAAAEEQDESLENYLLENDIDLNSITEQL